MMLIFEKIFSKPQSNTSQSPILGTSNTKLIRAFPLEILVSIKFEIIMREQQKGPPWNSC